MKLLIRKFWVLNALFLLGVAWFGARTVNAFIAGRCAHVPAFDDAAAGPTGSDVLKTERESRMAFLESIAASSPVPDVPTVDAQEMIRSGLRVRLIGTVVASRQRWSMATIEDVTDRSARVYMVGDELQTARIVRIERRRVIVEIEGRQEFIDLEPGDGLAGFAAADARQSSENSASGPLKAIGPGTYEITRADLESQIAGFGLMEQVQVVPAYKDGVAQGLKLLAIRPNSAYAKLGLHNGDVLRRVNGLEVDSPDKAMDAYTKLRGANRIEFEIERSGSLVRQRLTIR